MRRLPLSLFVLAMVGLFLAACDFRREQEVGVSEVESAEECPTATSVVVTPTETSLAAPSDTPLEEGTSTPVDTPAESPFSSPIESPLRTPLESPPGSPAATTDTATLSATGADPEPAATQCPETSEAPQASVTPEPTAEPTEELASAPTGGIIVFTREALDSLQQAPIGHLWMAGIDGSNQAQIADPEGCEGIDGYDLSPSGGHLAFTCAGGDTIPTTPLFVLALGDDGYTLISSTAVGGSAHWSPGGDRLAYLDGRDPGPYHIHTVAPDGSDDRDWGEVLGGSLGGWTLDGRVILNGAFGRCEAICEASVLLKLETGERTDFLDVSEVGPFSPDGRYLLATIHLPRTPANPSTNHPNPDFAVALIDLSNASRQQLGFQDRDVRPLRWIDEQTFLVGARKAPFNAYVPMDCQEWAVKVSDISQPTLISNECRDGYVSRDGKYVYFVRVRDPGNFPRVGDLYRLNLSDGSEKLWMADAMSAQIYAPSP